MKKYYFVAEIEFRGILTLAEPIMGPFSEKEKNNLIEKMKLANYTSWEYYIYGENYICGEHPISSKEFGAYNRALDYINITIFRKEGADEQGDFVHCVFVIEVSSKKTDTSEIISRLHK